MSVSRFASILRAPALHFAVAGALAFAVSAASPAPEWSGSRVAPRDRTIVVDAEQIRGLQRDYKLANLSLASEEDTQALVEKAIDDEILFREGLARGFEQGDRAIAWRLVQKMRYLGEDDGDDVATLYHRALELGLHRSDPVVRQILIEKVRLVVSWAAPPPTEAELEAWYDQHKGEFGRAERVTFRHVYFDRTRRGAEGAKQAAEDALRKAVGQGPEAQTALGGDPFLIGKRLAGQSPADLEKLFGGSFAASVPSLPAGSWQGPVESAYGWHVVFVEKRIDPDIPPLAEVRSRVEKQYENARRAERVAEFLESVRPEYAIEVDDSAIHGGQAG